jgi:hypothetical protein
MERGDAMEKRFSKVGERYNEDGTPKEGSMIEKMAEILKLAHEARTAEAERLRRHYVRAREALADALEQYELRVTIERDALVALREAEARREQIEALEVSLRVAARAGGTDAAE